MDKNRPDAGYEAGAMTEKVTCERCQHFTPDPINQPAGLGFCPKFNGYNYPAAQRYCREFKEKADAREQA